MKNDDKNTRLILIILGIIPVSWVALLIAPALQHGLVEIMAQFSKSMENPFNIELCKDSLKTVLIFLCAYGLSIGIAISSKRNYRKGEEYGSAKWGNARSISKKYEDKNFSENRVLTKNVRIGLDGRKHRRNLITLVVGGSGSGKSRFYAKVNLLQANTSFFGFGL